MRKVLFPIILLTAFTLQLFSQNYVSKVWVADNGNGSYKNPILHADYSDPDVCRVGNDYYMTASSFNCMPGLPILHSNDLVNWKLVNYALKTQIPTQIYDKAQHGNGVWAPSIRFHKGEFFIYWGDPDFGFYMIKTTDPKASWSEPVLVKAGKGLIDCCPFWDEDGNAYLSHAYAGSRAGNKSILALLKLSTDGTKAISESKIIFDGHENHPTVEGTKLYKRNGYYYIFAPAGGVSTGWQLVLRSKNIWGPYKEKIVLAQGKTAINGPHQGAWIDTPTGEDWFIHFQDKEAYGRITHLQPLVWKNDWPIIGEDTDGDGCGEPVLSHQKPNVGGNYPISNPVENDDFSELNLGLQWQWHANPQPIWYFNHVEKGTLRLYSVFTDSIANLWGAPNLLLQKFPAEEFTATTKLTFNPDKRYKGERIGFLVIGEDYSMISIENTEKGLFLYQNECLNASKGTTERVVANMPISESTVFLRINVTKGAVCKFSYSLDGKTYTPFGTVFNAKPGRWIGAKIGYICQRPKKSNDGGWADIDWFSIDK
jgi:beta-xylosidase